MYQPFMFVNDWNLSYNGKTLNISKEDLEILSKDVKMPKKKSVSFRARQRVESDSKSLRRLCLVACRCHG